MNPIHLKSPAKINLFLEILRRREDGYHEIETVMQTVGLYDDIHLRPSRSGTRLSFEGRDVPSGPENLAFRAVELLKRRYEIREGVHIHIVKRIPVAAGMGGGSSNAAAMLRGLNRLWDLGLSVGELRALASSLGADVPFFVTGGTAVCRGIGEQVQPLPFPGEMPLLLVHPGFPLPTAEIYTGLKMPLTSPPRDSKIMISAIRKTAVKKISEALFNRLEESVFERAGFLFELKKELRKAGAEGALVSGSGATMFAIASDPAGAARLQKEVEKKRLSGGAISVICFPVRERDILKE